MMGPTSQMAPGRLAHPNGSPPETVGVPPRTRGRRTPRILGRHHTRDRRDPPGCSTNGLRSSVLSARGAAQRLASSRLLQSTPEQSTPGQTAPEESTPSATKAPRIARGFCLRNPGGVLLSQGATPQVPSALMGLTAVFEMGTGVTPSPWPPETVRPRTLDAHPQAGSTSRLGVTI